MTSNSSPIPIPLARPINVTLHSGILEDDSECFLFYFEESCELIRKIGPDNANEIIAQINASGLDEFEAGFAPAAEVTGYRKLLLAPTVSKLIEISKKDS